MLKVDFSKAFRVLKEGGVVAYPTDTLYALGADIYNKMAVERVFELKQRPLTNPLSVAISDINKVEEIAYMDDRAKQFIDGFLPGPLTVILPKKWSTPNIVTSGLNTIAIWIPDNNIALHLLSRYGPLTATSANVHGKKTPCFVKEIQNHFGEKEDIVYLDCGKLDGQPSTMVDLTDFDIKVVCEGVINKENIWDAI